MSLETLLEAAKYVEQQELRQAQAQRVAFRVMSPSVPTTVVPPAPPPAPPAPPPLPCPQLARSPAAATPAPTAPGTHLPIGAGSHRSHLVLAATQQPPLPAPTVSEVLKPQQPVPVQTQPVSTATLSNGVDKCMVVEDGVAVAAAAAQELRKRHVHVQCVNKPGTREVHNKLEKNRRAHLKECFELLKKQLPAQQDEKKSSNLSILHSAYRHIQALKKKERENEHEMERLARDKIAAQQKLAALKKELGAQWDNIDFNTLLPEQGATAATAPTAVTTTVVPASPAPALAVKEERTSDGEDGRTANPTALAPPQLSVHLPLPQVGYPVSQGLVLGVHKVALVSKSLPLVTSPVTHIIATPPQLNGKVVPLVNAQYLMKPVVVVSTASAGGTTISPRPS